MFHLFFSPASKQFVLGGTCIFNMASLSRSSSLLRGALPTRVTAVAGGLVRRYLATNAASNTSAIADVDVRVSTVVFFFLCADHQLFLSDRPRS